MGPRRWGRRRDKRAIDWRVWKMEDGQVQGIREGGTNLANSGRQSTRYQGNWRRDARDPRDSWNGTVKHWFIPTARQGVETLRRGSLRLSLLRYRHRSGVQRTQEMFGQSLRQQDGARLRREAERLPQDYNCNATAFQEQDEQRTPAVFTRVAT